MCISTQITHAQMALGHPNDNVLCMRIIEPVHAKVMKPAAAAAAMLQVNKQIRRSSPVTILTDRPQNNIVLAYAAGV